MKAIKLTAEQVRLLKGKQFAPFMFFNVVKVDGEDYVFLSESDRRIIKNTEFDFLNSIEESDIEINNNPSYEN